MGERWQGQEAWSLPSEVRAGTALHVKKRFKIIWTAPAPSMNLELVEMKIFCPPNDGMSTKEVGLFQVSRQQTSHSTFKWSFVVFKSLGEGSETSSIALYDFIWHCFKRPLQPVVVEKSRKTASSKYCHLSVATHPGFEPICLKISLFCSPQ